MKDIRPKIHATLRKADIRRSTTHASGMVRGWSTWTTGYELRVDRNEPGRVELSWQFSSGSARHGRATLDDAEDIAKCKAALEPRFNVAHDEDRRRLIITEKETP